MNTDPYRWQDYIVPHSRWTKDLGVTVLFIGILALSSMSFELKRPARQAGVTTTSDVLTMGGVRAYRRLLTTGNDHFGLFEQVLERPPNRYWLASRFVQDGCGNRLLMMP